MTPSSPSAELRPFSMVQMLPVRDDKDRDTNTDTATDKERSPPAHDSRPLTHEVRTVPLCVCVCAGADARWLQRLLAREKAGLEPSYALHGAAAAAETPVFYPVSAVAAAGAPAPPAYGQPYIPPPHAHQYTVHDAAPAPPPAQAPYMAAPAPAEAVAAVATVREGAALPDTMAATHSATDAGPADT
jgi:hypothetical protein